MTHRYLFSAAALLLIVACTGIKARETVLMPAMSKAWSTTIAKHVVFGADAAEKSELMTPAQATEAKRQSEAMQVALDSGDRSQVAVINWAMLRPIAISGVQFRAQLKAGHADRIGSGVALQLIATVSDFDRHHTTLLMR